MKYNLKWFFFTCFVLFCIYFLTSFWIRIFFLKCTLSWLLLVSGFSFPQALWFTPFLFSLFLFVLSSSLPWWSFPSPSFLFQSAYFQWLGNHFPTCRTNSRCSSQTWLNRTTAVMFSELVTWQEVRLFMSRSALKCCHFLRRFISTKTTDTSLFFLHYFYLGLKKKKALKKSIFLSFRH